MSEQTVAIASLRLHPDAERVPMADPADLRALRDSLAENGQQDPIDVTEEGVILDGRTRWTLLSQLGAESILVRVQYVPEDQQTHWIVDRAIARRHLTMAQKKVLNDLLRAAVLEIRQPSATSAARGTGPMKIGYSRTQRAEKLGVDTATVQRWDADAHLVTASAVTRPAPTHAIDGRGRPQPIHKDQPAKRKPRSAPERPDPLRKSRPIPYWSRQFSTWCRSARPEDRDFLRRIDRELHAALDRNDIECAKGEAS